MSGSKTPKVNASRVPWDYVIVTASNDAQAAAYESELRLRHKLGSLPGVRHVMVVADPEGKRVGSGGSTLCCLIDVVNREFACRGPIPDGAFFEAVETVLRNQRILIIHAGGDSRRLPAYGPCGKIFIPIPGHGNPASGFALFDRIAPAFMSLPPGREGCGQVVIAAGDALVLFDPSNVSLALPGLTALACPDTPGQASKHGVFCAGADGRVRLYLQKPSQDQQRKLGAVNGDGQALLDIGIMSFDSTLAMALLHAFKVQRSSDGALGWPAVMKREVASRGVDFYREICCAMGEEATAAHHCQQAHRAGSTWSPEALKEIHDALAPVPFHLQTIAHARFLHFGTTQQLISSGIVVRQNDSPGIAKDIPLSLNNHLGTDVRISGLKGWVEGCRINAPLSLSRDNVVIGLEVNKSMTLPQGACIDMLRGQGRSGRRVWFVRCYGIKDTFKDTVGKGGTFLGKPILEWLADMGARPEDVWDSSVPTDKRSLWDARVFPAEFRCDGYRKWLWLFHPAWATAKQKQAFLAADRYSAAEIAVLADQNDFFARRRRLRQGPAEDSTPNAFGGQSQGSDSRL